MVQCGGKREGIRGVDGGMAEDLPLEWSNDCCLCTVVAMIDRTGLLGSFPTCVENLIYF